MASVNRQNYKGYRFGSDRPLSDCDLDALIDLFERPVLKPGQILNGRGSVIHATCAQLGDIVVKRYLRGGLMRHLIQGIYLRWGKSRAEVEFDLLKLAQGSGVKTPEPLAFAECGVIFYRAWLILREIKNKTNLAELCRTNEELAQTLLPKVAIQIAGLVERNIYHVDLHPGNVIVDSDNQLYILDFDKARMFKGPQNVLRDNYLVRWRRAVIKHGLPDWVAELVCPALRRNFDQHAQQ